MFARSRRISRAQFSQALKGVRFASEHFSYIATPKGYAVVVPKKVARLSVTRHRIKRRVLAVLRSLALPRGVIIFPKASATTLSYQEMYTELAQALKGQAR